MSGALEPVLNERSLAGDPTEFGRRVHRLATVLRELSSCGLPRVLRATAGFRDEVVGEAPVWGALHQQPGEYRESGRLVALYLSKAPHLDVLLAEAEHPCAAEVRIDGLPAHGLTYVALTDGLAVSFEHSAFSANRLPVTLTTVDEHGEMSDEERVVRHVHSLDCVKEHRRWVSDRLLTEIGSGVDVVRRAGEIWPSLRFGPGVVRQIEALNGREFWFGALCEHLQTLNDTAADWTAGPFDPKLDWSVESGTTMNKFGDLRDFQTAEGVTERFTKHSKIKSANKRIYFIFRGGTVVIGYVGDHLPTVNFPT